MKSLIRIRMGAEDAHYGGNLVDGAHMLHLFGDVATELLIRYDGDEGLFCAYDNVEFLAPVFAGDYIEAEGEIVARKKASAFRDPDVAELPALHLALRLLRRGLRPARRRRGYAHHDLPAELPLRRRRLDRRYGHR